MRSWRWTRCLASTRRRPSSTRSSRQSTSTQSIERYARARGLSPSGISLAPPCFSLCSLRLLLGRVLGVIEALLETPSYLVTFFALRIDLVVLLLQSYDHWFVSVSTVVFAVSFSVLFGDLRAVLIVSRWIGFQLPILIDANISRSKTAFCGVVINMLLMPVVVPAVSLNIIGGASDVSVAMTSYRSVSVHDTLINAIATMQILLLRIAVRKYKLTFRSTAQVAVSPSTVVATCVTIRSFVKLQAAVPGATRILPETPIAEPVKADPCAVQLRLTASNARYDSSDIVVPPLRRLIGSPRIAILSRMVWLTGILATTSSCFLRQQDKPISVIGAISTTAFVVLCWCLSNRRLLSQVFRSFDAIFFSLQISAAHLCLSDMLFWRPDTTILLACAWLWIHWAVALDALTPCTKASLGIQSCWWSAMVVSLYLCGQIVVVVCCVHRDRWPTQNRVLARFSLLGRKIEFRVLSFFVSRLVTIGVWTLRLLWRICRRPDPSKLVMLRGQVEFEYTPLRRQSGTT